MFTRLLKSWRSNLGAIHRGLASARHLRASAIVNGVTVAIGVALIAIVGQVYAPLDAAPLLLGAICASVADTPATLSEKMRRLGLAWALSTVAMIAATSVANTFFESFVVMAVGFCAAMVTAYGRPALPISVAILLALALAGSTIEPGQPVLLTSLWFALGGLCYGLYALVSTPLMMGQTKRLLVQEALRAIASYIRVQKAALEPDADQSAIYGRLIDSQAVLAERIQAARNVVFVGLNASRNRQIAAELLIGIDIFEAALTEQADLDALLEMRSHDEEMLTGLRGLLLLAASDLSRLSRSVVDPYWREGAPITDRTALFERIRALQAGAARPDAQAAVIRATALKLEALFEQIDRLRRAQADEAAAAAAIGPLDLEPFVQRSIFAWGRLKEEFSVHSTVMRFAVRLSLAMFCGSVLGFLLPYRAHGSWILLTVALVMRANYSVTRQRRRERLLGNVLGCVVAAVVLQLVPTALMPLLVFIAVGAAHAFVLQSYLVASAASCLMALLQLHMADAGDGIFFIMRIVDTMLGAAIAYAFSHLLPHWEHEMVSGLATHLLRAARDCAAAALKIDYDDQAYRLGRRRLFDAIAALSTATSRMLEEPASTPHDLRELSEYLAAAYVFAAEIASVQVFLRSRDSVDPQLRAAVKDAAQVVDARLEAALTGVAAMAQRASEGVKSDVLENNSYQSAGRIARRLRRMTEVARRVGYLGARIAHPSAEGTSLAAPL